MVTITPDQIKLVLAYLSILYSSIVIDLITLGFMGTKQVFVGKKRKIVGMSKEVSIIIPAYSEEANIYNVIKSAVMQTEKPKEIIVIEDNSPDNTLKECLRAQRDFPNITVIGQEENHGKAYNVTHVLKNYSLAELVIVLDADTFLSRTYLEKITPCFSNKRIVIATGTSLPLRQKGFIANLLYHGSMFTYSFFCFRKKAQSYRNAVSVVTGDSAVYRKSYLLKVGGLPLGTQTEDMDITWMALEDGYRIHYQEDALARSLDSATFVGAWKQIVRWFSGGFQCVFRHGFKLFRAPSLTFSTLIPSYIDSTLYSASILFYFALIFVSPILALVFLVTDLLFTLMAIAYLDYKMIIYLPHIYFIKILWSTAFLWAMIKTTFQFIFGRRNWSGGWSRSSFYRRKKK